MILQMKSSKIVTGKSFKILFALRWLAKTKQLPGFEGTYPPSFTHPANNKGNKTICQALRPGVGNFSGFAGHIRDKYPWTSTCTIGLKLIIFHSILE